MHHMRAVIVGGGTLGSSRALRRFLAQADVLICADGGLHQVRKFNLAPQAVIGDFDSADARTVAWARKRGSVLRRFPAEKDKTDTELALDYAIERGVTEVDFIAALGGRLDHTLANVSLLTRATSHGLRARILAGRSQLILVNSHLQLEAGVGDVVSLLAVTETVLGVTTQGLKYSLREGTLHRGSTLGISNEVITLPASVRVQEGLLLVLVTGHRASRRAAR